LSSPGGGTGGSVAGAQLLSMIASLLLLQKTVSAIQFNWSVILHADTLRVIQVAVLVHRGALFL